MLNFWEFLIFGQTPMSIGVKNEKRIPKEDTPLASEATSDVAKLAYVIFVCG